MNDRPMDHPLGRSQSIANPFRHPPDPHRPPDSLLHQTSVQHCSTKRAFYFPAHRFLRHFPLYLPAHDILYLPLIHYFSQYTASNTTKMSDIRPFPHAKKIEVTMVVFEAEVAVQHDRAEYPARCSITQCGGSEPRGAKCRKPIELGSGQSR